MTAAERAIKRMEDVIVTLSKEYELYMRKDCVGKSVNIFCRLRGLSDAVAILREEMQKERKQ